MVRGRKWIFWNYELLLPLPIQAQAPRNLLCLPFHICISRLPARERLLVLRKITMLPEATNPPPTDNGFRRPQRRRHPDKAHLRLGAAGPHSQRPLRKLLPFFSPSAVAVNCFRLTDFCLNSMFNFFVLVDLIPFLNMKTFTCFKSQKICKGFSDFSLHPVLPAGDKLVLGFPSRVSLCKISLSLPVSLSPSASYLHLCVQFLCV